MECEGQAMMRGAYKFGLTPESTVDWRGRIATTVWFSQCSYRCPFCHNGDLVDAKLDTVYNTEEVVEEIARRAGLVDGVVLSGGEPLFSFAQCNALCESLGGSLPIKLDTNGSFPSSFRDFVETWCPKHVAIDVKAAPSNYSEVVGLSHPSRLLSDSVMATVETALAFEVPHIELRTTVVPGLNEEDAPAIAEWMGHLSSYIHEYSVQAFKPGSCLDRFFNRIPATPRHLLESFAGTLKGAGFNVQIVDGVATDRDFVSVTSQAEEAKEEAGNSVVLAEDLEM